MDTETIKKEVDALLQSPFTLSQKEMCARMLSFIDLTTLDGTDTQERVSNLCKKAIEYKTAAVCVYPYYASLVKQNLAGSGIRTACVAGGFPASQLTLEMKLFEIEKTLANGADEIDMVISQGAFLEGDYKRVGDEVKAIKELCGEAHLKVILQTGNLQTPDNIEKASC
ncbi:MAG: deoxyribose-phosphate aldolase, partial [Bacteroidales bacterium]|nr:deoxyribose-phosphate aldolase [Bacteroidales bacterium]